MKRWRKHLDEIAFCCVGKLDVVLVDGTYVRNHFNSDFVQGGNGYRYKFIPKNEIWIDNSMPKKEIAFVIVHEVTEAHKMKKGMSYDKAHDSAKRIEDKMRRTRKGKRT